MADKHWWYVSYNSFHHEYCANYVSMDVMKECNFFGGSTYALTEEGAKEFLSDSGEVAVAWFGEDEAAAQAHASMLNGKSKPKNAAAKSNSAKPKEAPKEQEPVVAGPDEDFVRLQKKFSEIYGQAAKEAGEKLSKFMSEYWGMIDDVNAKFDAGIITRSERDAMLASIAAQQRYLETMADMLAKDAALADIRAMEAIKKTVPAIYADSANLAAYTVDKGLGQLHSFDLYDQSTVRRLVLLQELPDERLLPSPKVDAAKDYAWNRQKFASTITQSILQGDSIEHAAERLRNVFRMDEAASTRAARTAITAAENAGRVDSYRRAKAMGIELEQEWIATPDGRTRHSHIELDGQHVKVGGTFTVDGVKLKYPGDPYAPPEYVYNCRCTLVPWFPDIEQEDPQRWTNLPEGVTYEQWKGLNQVAKNPYEQPVDWKDYDGRMGKDNTEKARKMGLAQVGGLTSEQYKALRKYTGNSYDEINSYLRFGDEPWDDSLYDTIDRMDEALDSAKTSEHLNVMRGTEGTAAIDSLLSSIGYSNAKENPSALVGQVWYDDAYLSTSVDTGVADNFSGGDGIIFHMDVPEGANAIYVDSLSIHSGEQELLFRRHQEFVVTHAEFKEPESRWSSGVWHIWAQAIV